MTDNASSTRELVGRGIFWNTAYQVVQTVITFGSMLVLVRIIPPAEYGRAAAVAGILGLVNALSCTVFMSQALQLPDGEEPDWSRHFSAGFWIQTALSLATHGLAALCWLREEYRPIAPLLHLGALGIWLDWPGQLRTAMLRRRMDFRRLRIAHAVATLSGVATSLTLGLAGAGALAIVLANNVVLALPLTFEIFLLHRWRPRAGWWRWPAWREYRPALAFGFQQAGSMAARTSRAAIEAALLPGLLGYEAMGLLNRAVALFNTSVGRIMSVLVETAYPVLPRFAAQRDRFGAYAAALVQAVLLLAICGTVYLGLEGPTVSRVLYSERWIAADPLLWPGALAGLALAVFTAASSVVLAQNRLRKAFFLNLVTAAFGVPMLAVAAVGGGVVGYAWAVAAGQLAAAAIALVAASKYLAPGWVWQGLWVPLVTAAAGAGALIALDRWTELETGPVRLAVTALVYALATFAALRGLFPTTMRHLLTQLPRGAKLLAWTGLASKSTESAGGEP